MSEEIVHLYEPGKSNKQDIEFGDNIVLPKGSLTLIKRVTRVKNGIEHNSFHFEYKWPNKVK